MWGEAYFLPLVNQLQNIEKRLIQKKCVIRRLNVPNFVYLWKNFCFCIKDSKKTVKKKSYLEHFIVLWLIFFVTGVFQNFDVDFWHLLTRKKYFPEADFAVNFFS